MRFRWADYVLDASAHSLTRGGEIVRVQPLVFDLISLLIRNRGRVVAESVLREELWPGVIVSDASLRQLAKEARRAIGDDGKRQAQIETIRGRGLRFAAPVSSEDGYETRLVGREDTLEALERRLDELASGLGGVTLISGAAGLGKTRLICELEARAEARGYRCVLGVGRRGAEAFGVWHDIAQAFGIAALADLPGLAVSSGVGAEAARNARFRDTLRALERAGRERPTLIAFDDLERADRESIALLRFVSASMRHRRLWIVGAYRTIDSHPETATLRDLTALAADRLADEIPLRGLTSAELGELVGSAFASRVSPEAVEGIANRAAGNPLIALELARAITARTSLADAAPAALDEELEAGVSSLVARRTARLAPSTREVLWTASAIGHRFEEALLLAVHASAPAAVAPALQEAASSGLIEADGPHVWRFSHGLFADAIYGEFRLNAREPERVHLRIVDAIEAQPEGSLFAVAEQLSKASPAAPPLRVFAGLVRAGRAAWRGSAIAEAEKWYRAAAEVTERAQLPLAEHCDFLLELAEVLIAASAVADARAASERAAQIAGELGDRARLATAALAYAPRAFSFGASPTVLRWLEEAHRSPCGDASLDARVASRFGAELANGLPARRSEGEAHLVRAVASARSLADPFTLGRVLSDQSAATFSARDPARWIALAEEICRSAQASGDIEIEFRALHAIATGYLEAGERSAVESSLLRCHRFTQEHTARYPRAVTRGIEAMLALLDGRVPEAQDAIAEVEREARASGSLGLLALAVLQRLELARQIGGVRELLPQAQAARARLPGIAGVTALAGIVAALSGETAAAEGALSEIVKALPTLPYDRIRFTTLALAAEISFRTRHPDAAAALEPELTPFVGLGVAGPNAAVYLGSISQALGWLAAARGERSGAAAHFERAREEHEALRSPIWRQRSLDALAEL